MAYLDEIKKIELSDKKYVWHPFTQMKDWLCEKPILIIEGKDCFIKDIFGRWYLDGVSSLWVNIHGHKKKEVDDAIKGQLDKIAHSTLLGLCNIPSIKLAKKLITLTDKAFLNITPRLSKVFYSDNGSTSVEVALKMAFQYWIHKNIKNKHRFVYLENSYHGDTIGAVSVGGINIFHNKYKPLLFKTFFAPSPYCYRCQFKRSFPGCDLFCLEKLENTLKKHCKKIAAVILEPIVQSAGGMIVWPDGYLKGVRLLCNKYDVLLIADEVATGFGRTGKMFACEYEDMTPDIMCLSKGITNGYLPLAVTLTSDEIYNVFLGEFSELKTFFHGHSYTGNPLGCAAALKSIDIFEKENILKNMYPKIILLKDRLKDILELKNVGNVRNKGLMAGIELVKNKSTKKPFRLEEKIGWRVTYKAKELGLLIRPLGNVIVIMPPLSISEQNLDTMMDIIKQSIIATTK